MLLWFWAASATYALAGVLYLGFLLGLKERAMSAARLTLVAAFAVHTCEMAARGIAGMHPVLSMRSCFGV